MKLPKDIDEATFWVVPRDTGKLSRFICGGFVIVMVILSIVVTPWFWLAFIPFFITIYLVDTITHRWREKE